MLGIAVDESGNKRLSGARFVGSRFSTFSLGPVREAGQEYIVENCQFINCSVTAGQCVVNAGVLLRDVLFDGLSSRDSLTISANAVLDAVIVRGTERHAGIWVKPDEPTDRRRDRLLREWFERVASGIGTMLDVSQCFAAEVTIIGYPLDKVAINPKRHVRIKSEWNRLVDWEKLGIGPTSFWRLRLRYLRGFGADDGVFALPPVHAGKYERAMQEWARIREVLPAD